jgi:lipoyl(octanoyl) transferase
MEIRDLGIVAFAEAYNIQKQLADSVLSDAAPETLLLLEHLPVYTIGCGGDERNSLDPSIEVIRINRGGDITFHGPGQLVGYPIVNLSLRGKDLHRYLRFLEELIILTAADFGVDSHRVPGKTGVWTERGKLASIGVGARRWVTMHGFALNVKPLLAGFNRINPCGIKNCPLTSLEQESDSVLLLEQVKGRVMSRFERLFIEWLPKRHAMKTGR